MAKNSRQYRACGWGVGTDGWQQSGPTPEQKAAAKLAAKESYNLALAKAGYSGGKGGGGKGERQGGGKGAKGDKGGGKGKGDGGKGAGGSYGWGGNGGGGKGGNRGTSNWTDPPEQHTPKKHTGKGGDYTWCEENGCHGWAYLSQLGTFDIACGLCNALWNPIHLSPKAQSYWEENADRRANAGQKIPYDRPSLREAKGDEAMEISTEPVISTEEKAKEQADRIAALEAKGVGLAAAAAALANCDPARAAEMLQQKRETDEAKEKIIFEQSKDPSDDQKPVAADVVHTREEAYKHQAKCRRQETKAKEQFTNAQKELEALKEQLLTAESKVSFTSKQVSKAIKETQAADRSVADWSEPEIQKE